MPTMRHPNLRHLAWPLLGLVLCLLAWARPIDHDESQYVAAAVLSAHRLLPYRDYAYLQPPLQPMLLAAVAGAAGGWAWPALRLANALLGLAAVAGVFGAARAGGARVGAAAAGAGLFVCCDAFLFGVGVARNDALPAACLAVALVLIVTQEVRPTAERAIGAGLLLALAAAAKLSYALPAAAYLLVAFTDRRRRPEAVLGGMLPVAALVGWTAWQDPAAFRFGVLTFPATAPAQWYAGQWRMTGAGKIVDLLKFLALGPALLALVSLPLASVRAELADALAMRGEDGRGDGRTRIAGVLTILVVAGLLAAVLLSPIWRQYLLPALPPLFVRVALGWSERPPVRAVRIAAAVFAAAGLAPSVAAVAQGGGLTEAVRQGRELRAAMDRGRVFGTVATLSPEFLPATYRLPDPRFATGPFYYRSHDLLTPGDELKEHLLSQPRIEQSFALRPDAVLVGGEGAWTSGDASLDASLERWATAHGYQPIAVGGGRFRLYVSPAGPLTPSPPPFVPGNGG